MVAGEAPFGPNVRLKPDLLKISGVFVRLPMSELSQFLYICTLSEAVAKF